MNALCIRPTFDTPGKKDVSTVFLPEANAFAEAAGGGVVHAFDNRKAMAKRRAEVLSILAGEGDDGDYYDTIAFFCHGWATGIQAGFRKSDCAALVAALQKCLVPVCKTNPGPVIALYCCSTGNDPQDSKKEAAGTGDGSFADTLRDAFCAAGSHDVRVVAHTTAGHATTNPYVKFFDGMGSLVGGVGGYRPVAPGSKQLWPKWRRALAKTDLRFIMPRMSVAQIHEELLG